MLRGMGDSARQALNNPQFRRMMTDPEVLRQMAQMQRQFPGMFGGMGGMAGAQNQAFPAPGVTDQTPEQPSGERTATPNQPNTTTPPPPMNPFGMGLFGNPAGAGGAGGNPFAMLFPQQQPTPSENNNTNPSAGQADPNSTAPPSQANPLQQMAAQMASNPGFMQNMLGMMGGPPGGQGQPPHQTPNAPFNPFAAMFGPGGAGGANPFGMPASGSPPPPPDNRPPEERYAEQLRQLNDMGFYEFERNVEALRRTGGSVQGAVEYLLTH
ncbi:MAG: hypothetical protein Q9211_006545 [Gyalolechia sp. 1 TL-2023]